MHTFYYIAKKIINSDNKVFSESIIQFLFNILLSKPYSIKQKYLYYNTTNENIFLNSIKDNFISTFNKIQYVYLSFQKFAYIYKFKKTKIVVNTDIGLNIIEENAKNIICIYQNNGKYLFNIVDLNKIIYNSLTNSANFFSEPSPIKNPYNNLPFNKSNLYNIYFFIKFNTYYEIDLFEKYFGVNFNLSFFNEKYEYLLREYDIKNFVNKSSAKVLRRKIIEMLIKFNGNNPETQIIIDDDFPTNRLITILRPQLLLYITGLYSMVFFKKNHANVKLSLQLKRLYRFNPKFGRKIITITHCKNICVKKYKFNDSHVINKKDYDEFLLNHSTIDYSYGIFDENLLENLYANQISDSETDADSVS